MSSTEKAMELSKNISIPELADVEKLLWLGPKLIEEAEILHAEAEEDAFKQDKMVKAVWGVIAKEHKDKSIGKAEIEAYSDKRYHQQIAIASNAKKRCGVTEARLNAMRNMYKSAESLKNLYQSKMRIR